MKKKAAAALLAAAVLLSLTACGNQPSAPEETTVPATQAATEAAASPLIQALVDQAVAQMHFGGVVYITQNGRLLAQSATGTADAANGTPVTMDTQFCVASVSKQFAAAAVMLLQEQGKLHTSDTLDTFFPDYAYGDRLTVRHLLTMRSGVADHIAAETEFGSETLSPDEWGFTVSEDNTLAENRSAVLEWLLAQPLRFEPDTQYEYSNGNYFLLAQIVQQTAGVPYEDFIRQHIFEPLGMTHSGFVAQLWDSPHAAMPTPADDPLYTPVNAGSVTPGAADIVTTAQDMDRWLTSLREQTLLSDASYAEMTANYSPDGGSYGYGLMVDYMGDGIGHTGMIASYTSFAYTNPDNGCNFFAVTNDCNAVTDDITEIVRRVITGISA